MNPGPNRLPFDLVTAAGGILEGGSPRVWVARDETSTARGPFAATWHDFTGYGKTGDRSPVSPLKGFYSGELDFPGAGNWMLAVTLGQGSKRFAATGIVPVTAGSFPHALGSKAVSTPTPVATTTRGIEEICTRTPVDRMHYVSLEEALANGKPTVVAFATPLLCQSQLCGPVVDEQILVFEKFGPNEANFIHVEEFPPGPSRQPPPATLENQSPAFKRWGLQSEPWLFVIDRDGVIRFRSLGPVSAAEIEAALQVLL
jgi:hypothetical protein